MMVHKSMVVDTDMVVPVLPAMARWKQPTHRVAYSCFLFAFLMPTTNTTTTTTSATNGAAYHLLLQLSGLTSLFTLQSIKTSQLVIGNSVTLWNIIKGIHTT